MARLEGSSDYASTPLKGSRHRPPGDKTLAEERAEAYAGGDARLAAAYLRGWRMGEEVDREHDSWRSRQPVAQPELAGSIPAPDWPAGVGERWHPLHQAMYVLRR